MITLKYFTELVNYVKNFNKNIFQGQISYHKVKKEVMLYELFGHLQIFKFLKDKKSNDYVNIEKYTEEFFYTFNNTELSEQGIINLYLDINEQKKYIRNVKLVAFIIYKENWNVFSFDKFIKNRNILKQFNFKQ